jgi:hypothetical protein
MSDSVNAKAGKMIWTSTVKTWRHSATTPMAGVAFRNIDIARRKRCLVAMRFIARRGADGVDEGDAAMSADAAYPA